MGATEGTEAFNDETKKASEGVEQMSAEMKKFANSTEVFNSALGRSRRGLLTFSDGRLKSDLGVAKDKVAELSRELEENNKISSSERKGIERRVELGKEIINTLSKE